MALFGLSPDVMKPTTLFLNILVASIAALQFLKAGYFSWTNFWPFALASIPFAFLGGTISIPLAILFGAGIGFLSGSIGIGGGIFLSPFILLMGWAQPRQTAGVSAAFILVNSVSGLIGHLASIKFIPGDIS